MMRRHDVMITNEIKLPRAVPTDCRLMAAIHATAFPAHDAWSETVFCRQLGFPGVFGLLHPSGGLILVRVVADDAEILTLAVLPEARRGGIATALLHESGMIGAAMGASALFLEVSVANSAARALYTRTGFAPVGRRPGYYSDRSDALVLRRDILNLS
jgi:[ribosomal protein S18]-alanine N-acetyltransferase